MKTHSRERDFKKADNIIAWIKINQQEHLSIDEALGSWDERGRLTAACTEGAEHGGRGGLSACAPGNAYMGRWQTGRKPMLDAMSADT